MPLEPGATFARFRIGEPLGKGGMGAVYDAHEAELDRDVALKVLHTQFVQDENFSVRFQNEARIVARLEHPNIVPIYRFGIDEGTPWMAMRRLTGGTLDERQRRRQRQLAPAEIITVLQGTAAALDHAHQHGVIHRDVKPTNIMFDEAGHVYLTDFGIAAVVIEATMRITGVSVVSGSGSPPYMAPEQVLGSVVDGRADVYALGVVAYEMLTGTVPFTAATSIGVLMKHVQEPVPIPPPAIASSRVIAPILTALEKDPAKRHATATAFVAALCQALTAVTAQEDAAVTRLPGPSAVARAADDATASSEPGAPEKKRRRKFTFAISISISFVALVLAVWVQQDRRASDSTMAPTDPPAAMAAPPPPPPLPPSPSPRPLPAPEGVRGQTAQLPPLFNALTGRGERALREKDYAAAASALDAAQRAAPDEFRKRGLDVKLNEARSAESRIAALQAQAREALANARATPAPERADAARVEAARTETPRLTAAQPAAPPLPPAVVSPPATSLPPGPANWTVPYEKALDAIKKEQWQASIPLLEQAIAADPTPDANKRIEAVVTMSYFPQYYLFLAHLKTNQLEKARQYYTQRGPLPPSSLAREAQRYYQELVKAEDAQKRKP